MAAEPTEARQEFADLLSSWRGDRSQAAVDRAIGIRGFCNQAERLKLRPPDEGTTRKVAAALGMDGDEAWAAVAPLRLRDFGEDVWDWHREQVDTARRLELTEDEAALIAALRRQQGAFTSRGLAWAVPRHLARVLDVLNHDLQLDNGRTITGAPAFVVFLARLQAARPDAIHQLFQVLGQLASKRAVPFDVLGALAQLFRWIREDSSGRPEAPLPEPDPADTYDPLTDDTRTP